MAKTNNVMIEAHPPVTLTEVKEILRAIWGPNGSNDLVPMLHGPPGVGKTSIVYQVAQELGYEDVVMIRAAEMRPEDITGPPFPYEGGHSQFHPPLRLLELTKEYHEKQKQIFEEKKKRGEVPADAEYKMPGPKVLFLDELPNAHPDVQATLHSLVLDRKFGVEGYTLLDNVKIIAAGNRREDGAHVYELTPAMATRMAPHLVVRPSLEEWIRWARSAGIHPAIIAFLPQREELLYDYDPKSKALTYPSFRTWEKASNLCWQIPVTDDKSEELLRKALAGTIGPGATAEFMNFLKTARKAPSAEDIAKDPDNTPTFEDDPDIALVCVENMIAAARRKPEWARAFVRYGKRMHEQHRELLFPALLNIDGNMPQATIEAVLTSGEDFQAIAATSNELRRILKEGDEAVQAAKRGRGVN